jgi:ketosteroid isomerase-like protein
MRLIPVLGLLALWITTATATEWRAGSTEDRAAMEKIIESWKVAYATGDGQVVANGYDPKGFVMAEGAPMTYPDVLGPRMTKMFTTSKIDMLIDVQEGEFNGTWAFIQGTFASKRTAKEPKAGDEPRYHAGRFFTLMRKTNEGWKVWRNMDTSSPDANNLLEQLKK